MSYTDDDDNDDINEYQDSDESSFGEEDEKVKLLSKKQKQLIAFKKLVRTAKQDFNNSQFLDFQQDLKAINDEIIKNKWSHDSHKMPKFYVKHMLEIYNKIQAINPKQEKNQKEQRALKSLKKNLKKEIKHCKQLQVFEKNPTFWKDEESDLGEMENDENYDDESDDDDDALYSLQDTAKDKPSKPLTSPNIATEDGDDIDFDDDEEDEDKSTDDDDDEQDSDDEDESTWSSWEGGAANDINDEPEDEVSDEHDTDDEEQKGDAAATGEGGGAAFGSEAFDEETLAKMRHRSFWVKKAKKKNKVLSEKEKKRLAKLEALKEAEGKDGDQGSISPKEAATKQEKRKTHKPKVHKWSVSKIREIFSDVLANRGKSSVNREQIVSRLEECIEQCELHNAEQARLTVISVLVSFYFDTATRKTTGMSGSRWRHTRTLLTQMLKSLSKNIDTLRVSNDADIRLILKDDDGADGQDKSDQANIDWMNALQTVDEDGGIKNGGVRPMGDVTVDDGGNTVSSKFGANNALSVIRMDKKKKLDPKYQWIQGNILSYIKKLTNQLWTNLKSLEARSEQYEKRKKNTDLLIKTYKQAVHYFGKLNDPQSQSQIEVLWMSVIHAKYSENLDELKYKIDQEKLNKEKRKNKMKNGDGDDEKKEEKKIKKVPQLSTEFRGQQILNLPKSLIVNKAIFVFENGSTRNQTAAMLYLIFNMALHNRFELCRDLLLMSHLGSSSRIGQTNVELQILYNRALAQYAVCAFINGYWYSAMIILQELFASNRIKILLAQGFIKAPLDGATAEQTKQEQLQQARMLPWHFHINNDLLEAAHLLSALFIEIPNMISNSYTKSFIRNQQFRQTWHRFLRRDLRVPPENTKDYILTTGINMQNGEYQTCKAIINKLKLWNEVKHPRYVKKKVFSTMKRECMRCYLYRYGCVYQNISIKRLSEMFELTESHTKQFISKLIITSGDTKFASLDELTQCVVMHQSPPMPIQRTALEYSDKLSFLIEQNEKLLGIYSRYSSFGGGGKGGKFKGKGTGKDGKDDSKQGGGGDDKNKGGNKGPQRKQGGRSRFGGQQSGNQQSKPQRQFGTKQTVRTQLRKF